MKLSRILTFALASLVRMASTFASVTFGAWRAPLQSARHLRQPRSEQQRRAQQAARVQKSHASSSQYGRQIGCFGCPARIIA